MRFKIDRRRSRLTLVGAAVAVIAVAACVGDDPSTDVTGDGGIDASTTDVASGGDAGDAATAVDAGTKTCDGKSVSVNDPSYGCTPTSCTACTARPHTTTQKCVAGACAIATCDPAYDDLNGDVTDGCETANPLAFQPDSLSLWLKGDIGVAVSGDGGVTSVANQATESDAGATLLATGHPTIDTTLWPAKPGMQSVLFLSGDSLSTDFKGMMGGPFTFFIVNARYGDTENCVAGSNTYPSVGGCCVTSGGGAFQLCGSDTDLEFEPFCSGFHVAPVANTSSGYQANEMSVWFDPSVPRFYGALNGGATHDNSADGCNSVGALYNLNPGRIGGGYGGPGYTGLLGELIIYSVELSTPDRTAVQSYLKTKWKTP